MLLPHGLEGAGPEHSSARLERFLQLCAEHNMQVCVPSTPAQVFHMLRRQVIRPLRKPLIALTPKSLLRHKRAVSTLVDLCEGKFYSVIGETETVEKEKIERLVLCSGKVYYDLTQAREEMTGSKAIAIARMEQLYPFPEDEYEAELARYPNLKEVVWCQEEPMNQGAWYSMQHRLKEPLQAMDGKVELLYAGRDAFAAPAVGYPSIHNEQQKQLVDDALFKSFT